MAEHRPEQPHTTEGNMPPPQANFFQIVHTLAVPALIFTGHAPNPVDEKAPPDLRLAKYQIDLLEILETKTKGNLDKDEETFLEEMLHAVRLAYVRATDKVAREASAAQGPAGEEQQEGGEKKA